jgi:dephospho-CoA kinase
VIDADRLGHRVYEPGTPAHRAVVAAFGSEVVAADGSIDRAALGARVFGRPEQLRRLTDIVWPEIQRLAEAEIAAAHAERPDAIVVLDAAVLLEAGWGSLADEIWVVIVDRARPSRAHWRAAGSRRQRWRRASTPSSRTRLAARGPTW